MALWAGVCAVTADAGAVAPVTATAVSISVPGAVPVSTPSASLPGTASVTAAAWASSASAPVVAVASQSASIVVNAAGTAAQVQLQDVQMFGGELAVSALQLTALRPTAGVAATATAQVGEISLAGVAVTAPVPGGATTPLADWGQLSVTPSIDGGVAAGIRIQLTADHGGLPAGSEIDLGRVSFPPAPVGGDGQGSQGDGSSSHPVTPPPTGKRRHHQAPPAPRHHRAVVVVHHPLHLPALGRGVRARVVRAAARQIGWPYLWGGESREEGGFDCSGLVDYAYAAAGRPLPGRPTAALLWQMGVPVARHDLKPGDLVFLGARTGRPYHVAIYAGSGMVIVASGRGRPIAAEPLNAVAWDGFAHVWAPGGPAGLHQRSRGQAAVDPADLLAAARVRAHDVTAAFPASAPPAETAANGTPTRQPRRSPEPHAQTPMLPADPRLRPAPGRAAFALPTA